MILIASLAVAALLVALAVATAVGARLIDRAYPPGGRFLALEGGRLHVLELGAGNADARAPVLVLLHGASSNLQDMRLALGERLAQHYRVILVDRPGAGWSDRSGDDDAAPARQAEILHQALDHLKAKRVLLVAHSWSGSLAAAFAIRYPTRLAGLVMLAPVTHPWPGGIAWYYNLTLSRLAGWAFAHTLALPVSWAVLSPVVRAVFAPSPLPSDYIRRAAIPLTLRPRTFLANARDIADLKANVAAQVRDYPGIRTPTVIITGADDTIVSPRIHSVAFAAAVPNAKLILLAGTGHMPHYAAPDLVIAEIERLAGGARDDPRR
jgi:pimeloyl-ACP methyl ester carboxylesterase